MKIKIKIIMILISTTYFFNFKNLIFIKKYLILWIILGNLLVKYFERIDKKLISKILRKWWMIHPLKSLLNNHNSFLLIILPNLSQNLIHPQLRIGFQKTTPTTEEDYKLILTHIYKLIWNTRTRCQCFYKILIIYIFKKEKMRLKIKI